MNALLPALVALLTIFVAGLGPSVLLLRRGGRVRLLELGIVSWLLGTVLVSLGLWLLGTVLRDLWLHIALTLVCLGSAAGGVALLVRARTPRFQLRLPRTWLEGVLAFSIVLQIAIVVALTFKNSLGWDGLLIWELKARYAFLNGGALPPSYFYDATRVYGHPEYPLYLPMLEMWMYFWIGDCHQYWVKLIFPVYYGAGVLLIVQATSAWTEKRWIGLLAGNLFFFIPLLTRAEGGVVQGYADMPLSIFYFAAFYYLSVLVRENSRDTLAMFVIFTAALPWIKRDGLILCAVLAVGGGWLIWKRRAALTAILSLLPALGVIAAWRIYVWQMGVRAPNDFAPVTASVLVSNLNRLGPVMLAVLKETTSLQHWSLLWLLTPFAFLSLAWRRRSELLILLLMCTLGPIGLYCSTYLFSAWQDYSEHVISSLPRLLLHVAPLAVLALAAAIAPPPRAQPDTAPNFTA